MRTPLKMSILESSGTGWKKPADIGLMTMIGMSFATTLGILADDIQEETARPLEHFPSIHRLTQD